MNLDLILLSIDDKPHINWQIDVNVDRAEVRGRKRRRIQEEEELFTSSIVQVKPQVKVQ